MFRRILIPTDFSTASEWVFDDAVRIAERGGAELVIVHVRMTRTSNPGELRFAADSAVYEYAEQQELDRLRDRVRRVNASLATRLIVRQAPDPGNTICEVAKEERADLIVIATHARHHVAHLFVGSTTVSVLDDPPCPVLAIRYGIRKRGSIRREPQLVRMRRARHPHVHDHELRTAPSRDAHGIVEHPLGSGGEVGRDEDAAEHRSLRGS